MRRRTLALGLGLAIVLGAPAAGSAIRTPGGAEPAAASSCAPASLTYRGAAYRLVALRAHRRELGLRLRRPAARSVGVLTSHVTCTDVIVCTVGEPCTPPPQPPPLVSNVPVLRLAGVSPAVALASDNPGIIYVAGNACPNAGNGKRLAACLKRTKRLPPVPGLGPVVAVDRESVVQALRARGLAMAFQGRIDDRFFGRERHAYSDNIWIFEFADEREATTEAGNVSSDGSIYASRDAILIVNWIDAPHFFLAGRAILLYVGRDPEILGVLRATLGEQFAGR